jgi:hypothetical protein
MIGQRLHAVHSSTQPRRIDLTRKLPVRNQIERRITMNTNELMRNNEFMADFFLAAKKITAAELRAKHGVSADELRSIVKIVRAQRNGDVHEHSPKDTRKKPAKQVVKPPATSFADDSELVEDLARYADGILSEKEIRKRHRLDEKAWLAMAKMSCFANGSMTVASVGFAMARRSVSWRRSTSSAGLLY